MSRDRHDEVCGIDAASSCPACRKHFEAPPEPGRLPLVGWGDLLTHYGKLRPPVIHGLLRQGETMNIIAPTKVGKSWLIHDLAISVATGRPWLGTFRTEKGKVLLIDNELHRETLAHRLGTVATERGINVREADAEIVTVPLRGRLVDLGRLAQQLVKLPAGEFALVIIDAFYRVLPRDTDENDNGAMAALYNEVDAYADALSAANAIIHHASKGNQSEKSVTDVGSGAGAQSRAADTHLVLRPHEEDGAYVLDAAVRSWPPVAPLCLRWKFPVWELAPDLDPAELRQGARRRKKEPAARHTPKTFAAAFARAEPESRFTILDRATAAGLSMREAERVFQSAVHAGELFQWTDPTNRRRPLYATVPCN